MTRTTVVSGGGTGIGKAVAARFAADGDRVVLIGRRAGVLEKAAAEIGGTALPADLSEPAEVERVRAELAERFGTIDVLVNNAGGNVEGHGGPVGLAERWTGNFRAGTPRDIAETVHWLASPGAGHVTAQIIQVNGGAEHGR